MARKIDTENRELLKNASGLAEMEIHLQKKLRADNELQNILNKEPLDLIKIFAKRTIFHISQLPHGSELMISTAWTEHRLYVAYMSVQDEIICRVDNLGAGCGYGQHKIFESRKEYDKRIRYSRLVHKIKKSDFTEDAFTINYLASLFDMELSISIRDKIIDKDDGAKIVYCNNVDQNDVVALQFPYLREQTAPNCTYENAQPGLLSRLKNRDLFEEVVRWEESIVKNHITHNIQDDYNFKNTYDANLKLEQQPRRICISLSQPVKQAYKRTYTTLCKPSLSFSIIDSLEKRQNSIRYRIYEPRDWQKYYNESIEERDYDDVLPGSLKIRDIFNNSFSNKRVVMLGAPNIGKTAVLKDIVYQWINNGLFSEIFELVIYISLPEWINRVERTSNLYVSLEEILEEEYYIIIGRKLNLIEKEQLNIQIQAGKILLLLDDYDLAKNIASIKSQTLLNQMLVYSCYILTTRYETPKVEAYLNLEIIGCRDEEIHDYVHEFFNDRTKAEKVLNFIKTDFSIWKMAHVPTILQGLCQTYSDHDYDIRYSTELLKTLVGSILKKYLINGNVADQELTVDEIFRHPFSDILLRYLSFLAFCSKEKGVNNVNNDMLNFAAKIFNTDSKILKSIINKCELLIEIKSSHGQIYSYVNEFFQDFLVAQYISACFINKEKFFCYPEIESPVTINEMIKNNKLNPRYKKIWPMVANILSNENEKKLNEYFNILLGPPFDSLKIYAAKLLISCINESIDKLDASLVDKVMLPVIKAIRLLIYNSYNLNLILPGVENSLIDIFHENINIRSGKIIKVFLDELASANTSTALEKTLNLLFKTKAYSNLIASSLIEILSKNKELDHVQVTLLMGSLNFQFIYLEADMRKKFLKEVYDVYASIEIKDAEYFEDAYSDKIKKKIPLIIFMIIFYEKKSELIKELFDLSLILELPSYEKKSLTSDQKVGPFISNQIAEKIARRTLSDAFVPAFFKFLFESDSTSDSLFEKFNLNNELDIFFDTINEEMPNYTYYLVNLAHFAKMSKKEKSYFSIFTSIANHTNSTFRMIAASVFGYWGYTNLEILDNVYKLMDDKEADIKKIAIVSLGNLELTRRSMEALLKYLRPQQDKNYAYERSPSIEESLIFRNIYGYKEVIESCNSLFRKNKTAATLIVEIAMSKGFIKEAIAIISELEHFTIEHSNTMMLSLTQLGDTGIALKNAKTQNQLFWLDSTSEKFCMNLLTKSHPLSIRAILNIPSDNLNLIARITNALLEQINAEQCMNAISLDYLVRIAIRYRGYPLRQIPHRYLQNRLINDSQVIKALGNLDLSHDIDYFAMVQDHLLFHSTSRRALLRKFQATGSQVFVAAFFSSSRLSSDTFAVSIIDNKVCFHMGEKEIIELSDARMSALKEAFNKYYDKWNVFSNEDVKHSIRAIRFLAKNLGQIWNKDKPSNINNKKIANRNDDEKLGLECTII